MFIDSHCHLDRLDYDDLGTDIAGVIENAEQAGVSHFLCVSVTLDAFPTMLEKILPYKNVFASCGVHPLDHKEAFNSEELISLAQHDKVVAVGETGLDYFYAKETQKIQQEAFVQHIDVANKLNKPLIIHTRDARADTIAMMREHQADKCGGVLHCFTESWDMAKAALDLGFYISISGIATFRNAAELRDVVKKIPLDRLLIETDSPYLAPVPHRGKQNQPAYVKHVCEFLADHLNIDSRELAKQTSDNFFSLFPLAQR
ncbi:TatD family hydrolase [Flocculibacter collagenilyticus]|uniref:TatD family hydrolase n=1 Tax=Flocculibacter collagenilyticus TaxID=2744479 RepID=UPI0018F77544|nr:TatD family hydrolase [Flocculibacter collagenilyticus]